MTPKQKYWQEHLAKQAGSGISRREYCSREQLNYDHMQYYAAQFRRKNLSNTQPQPSAFIKLPSPSSQQGMTISLTNGVKIDCPFDSEILAALVRSFFASHQHLS